MRIGGLQKLTLLDYPGKTACTVFLQGCNFRCPYCHNKGLVIPPKDEFLLDEGELFRFLKKRQGLLDGVCVTGGEPLLHKDIFPFLEQIKDLGYQIKLDTNGSFPKRLIEVTKRGLADYVAMDIKHTKEKYGEAAGWENVPMDAVCESVSFLLQGTVNYEFRTTLVKGIHSPEDMDAIAEWIFGASVYYLQNFKDSGNLIGTNQSNRKMESFDVTKLNQFLTRAKAGNLNAFIRNS